MALKRVANAERELERVSFVDAPRLKHNRSSLQSRAWDK